MKKNCLTLILPSLLSGCAGISGSNNVAPSDTPALVFVDGQISESAGGSGTYATTSFST